MLTIHYISTECYPVAKVGGLGDVTGALPKYVAADVRVILPKYNMPWFEGKTYISEHRGVIDWPDREVPFEVLRVEQEELGFALWVIDIPGLLDRDGVYASRDGHYFDDEADRYTAFQRAYLQWLMSFDDLPDVVHCQDHHTGLIPFLMQHSYAYERLRDTATVFTIHNERYQGAFEWERQYLLPAFDTWKSGLIDWDHKINPLAAGIKCADAVTTVSPSYMAELQSDSYGLEWLFRHESDKLQGILNGIDTEVWDPKKDPLITQQLKRSVAKYKRDNKAALLKGTGLDAAKPLFSFIGRFAVEKGADLLPGIIDILLSQGTEVNFYILGTGDSTIEDSIRRVADLYPDRVHATIAYDEQEAHQIYAGADFLMMPSRVEPCGLNQMYALRYGTVPIVHSTGGLSDSIIDIAIDGGYGIKHDHLFVTDIIAAIDRAIALYAEADAMQAVIKTGMQQDFSWGRSAAAYLQLYQHVSGITHSQ